MKITVILYKFNTLANGEHPIMLRLAHKKERALISLGISSSIELWDLKKNAPKRHHPSKELIETIIAQKIHTYRTKLLELVSQQEVVTPSTLVQALEANGGKKRASTVFSFFNQIIDRLLQTGKVGNANVYKDTKRSLNLFTNSTNLFFTDIDQTFLHNYETFLRKLGLAETSISVYFRTLRALFNKAIQEKLINLNAYPFKEFSVAKFNTATKKRAITKEELKKIENLELDPASSLSEGRQYFLFSYYGQGINFIDIAQLQWKNIIQDRIVYTRAKTGKIIQFKLLPPAKAIIEYYKPLTGNHPENYIFPILSRIKHVTAIQIDNRVTKVLKRVNRDLKEIARLAQIDANLTTYVARHTYATVLKKSNVPTAVISEALGHKSEFITQTYLKSFENEVIDLANECLL
ncbi:MAG: site-specific integrase [Candidatus Amoebophilus sp.]